MANPPAAELKKVFPELRFPKNGVAKTSLSGSLSGFRTAKNSVSNPVGVKNLVGVSAAS
jgi:hypothetical protein